MSNAQLILIDKRNQPLKEYIVAVAASDGLNIKGVEIMASPAKGETSLLNAQVIIPPLEQHDFNLKKLVKETLKAVSVKDEIMDIDTFIERCSEDETVRAALKRSVSKLSKKIEELLKEFLDSEVIPLILERRNDALYKLKEHAEELKGKKIVCIDIEATNISTDPEADIIQLSACDGEGKELFNQLINPGYDIPENEKHNITTEMVVNEPLLAQVWDQIHDTLRDADVVLAYSTESDFMYLEKSAEKKMLRFELDYNTWLDVAELSRDLNGAIRWHSERMYWFYKTPKLTDAYEKVLGKPFPGDAHDALADAQATVDLFNAMLDKGRKSQIGEKKKPKQVKQEITNNPFAAAFANAKRS
ncbi:3'-5' exonuclease [Thiomicrorhabdus sp. 6S3-12]|uniref:3'-5' exonuclease n=1 Tax=Thiomicrorhabdus sp. 6S3-12 TaxID=2819681 RepID=UPI001AAD36F7|nr:3'-5' exonuclease [Thiomicrorhabdus sp. 6S3-12]MBO1923290.1 3'-5' exonuclease [Thiomicrorhabdus sp. 6S3-12]